MPVISDFLFDDSDAVLRELALLNATHDVFLVMADSSFAFEVPHVSAGWIDAVDVETGRTCTLSRDSLSHLAVRIREWQGEVRRAAKELDLDVVQVGFDSTQADLALGEFVAERRLRKTDK